MPLDDKHSATLVDVKVRLVVLLACRVTVLMMEQVMAVIVRYVVQHDDSVAEHGRALIDAEHACLEVQHERVMHVRVVTILHTEVGMLHVEFLLERVEHEREREVARSRIGACLHLFEGHVVARLVGQKLDSTGVELIGEQLAQIQLELHLVVMLDFEVAEADAERALVDALDLDVLMVRLNLFLFYVELDMMTCQILFSRGGSGSVCCFHAS